MFLNFSSGVSVIMIHPSPRNPPSEHIISETDSPIDSQPASPPPAEISSSAGSGVLCNVIDLPEHGSYLRQSTSPASTTPSSLSLGDLSQMPPPERCSTPMSSEPNSPSRASPHPAARNQFYALSSARDSIVWIFL